MYTENKRKVNSLLQRGQKLRALFLLWQMGLMANDEYVSSLADHMKGIR
jgi:hypothetical protein